MRPADLTPATKSMEQEQISVMIQDDMDALDKTFEEKDDVSNIEAFHTIHLTNTNGAASETVQKELTEEKWKYITCSLAVITISYQFFGLYFSHWHSLTNLLSVMIYLIVFSAIFGVLSYIVYQKISEEERFKSEENANNHQIKICSLQLCLFFLFVILTATAYVLVAINAIGKHTGAHKP